jgi:hypothetical protein
MWLAFDARTLLPVGGRHEASPERTFAANIATPFLLRTDISGKASRVEPAAGQLSRLVLELQVKRPLAGPAERQS